MCKNCFEQEFYNFPTYTDFENFKDILDKKCRGQKFEILESENERTKGIIDFHMYFQCQSCNEKFILSFPENTWRGYFLTEKNAVSYHKNLRTVGQQQKKWLRNINYFFLYSSYLCNFC